MSYLDTKQALLTQLRTVVDVADVAFENNKFDPKNKSLWFAAYFLPVSSEIMGKTAASSNEDRGIFQVSVFVPINGFDSSNTQLQAIDDVLSGFLYNTSIVYNDQKVDILSSTVNNGTESEAWYQRDISINYLTFSERV
jgi:hypothetical protein